jgi:two-component sensor histidine kinase
LPAFLFVAIAAITAFSVFAIESNARARERSEVEAYAQTIASSLAQRGNSFSAYMRAGAALFTTMETVEQKSFRQFVAELRLDQTYRGLEGIGWLEVEPVDASRRGLLGATPGSEAAAMAERSAQPTARIAFLVPDTLRNRRTLGYDMYSEVVRAKAMDEARSTVQPTASGRILLSQGLSGEVPGFVIFMPVFRELAEDGSSDNELAGFIFSAFNAAEFLDAALENVQSERYGVRLYDGEPGTANLLVSRSLGLAGSDRIEADVRFANRDLLLVIEGPGRDTLSLLSTVTLVFGLALASLLMLVVRLLTKQAMEDEARIVFFEEQHSIRNSLSRELNHRVKNTLANVLSILSLTRRRAHDLDDFADSLEGRIRALSATHDLLTGLEWSMIPLRSVVEAELRHVDEVAGHDLFIEGPPLELAPNDALSLGLALHELATNAAKYGALSVPGGVVSVRWKLVRDDLAEVEWLERGGPPVSALPDRGFGTQLIEKIVAHELRNRVQLEFHPNGVRCVFGVPVRRRDDFKIRARLSAQPEDKRQSSGRLDPKNNA